MSEIVAYWNPGYGILRCLEHSQPEVFHFTLTFAPLTAAEVRAQKEKLESWGYCTYGNCGRDVLATCSQCGGTGACNGGPCPALPSSLTPCTDPPCNYDGNGEPCDRHEIEQAHAEGEHELCGLDCEGAFPSQMLRNTILYRAIPGSKRMLEELERRALEQSRKTQQRLNREKQRLESELAAYRRAVAQWEVSERGTYIPHASLRAIGLASGKDILGSVRHLKHFERVEQAETRVRELEAERARLRAELGIGDLWNCPACGKENNRNVCVICETDRPDEDAPGETS